MDKVRIKPFDLAIIGAGSGGLSLASGCAQLGLKVVLFESDKMGGDCLNTGCVPSKSLLAAAKSIYQARHQAKKFGLTIEKSKFNFKQVMRHVHDVMADIAPHDSVERFESMGVQVEQSAARFIDTHTLTTSKDTFKARKIVIATGSKPFIPPIEGLDKIPFYTNESIFELTQLPRHLIVIGGGPIGCELAQAFCMLGSQVTLIEADSVLPRDEPSCVAVIKDSMLSMGIRILESSQIHAIESDMVLKSSEFQIHLSHASGTQCVEGTHLLVATGRTANVEALNLDAIGVVYSSKGVLVNSRLQTCHKHIYAIGDVAGPYQFTHMASYQASIVLRQIAFKLPSRVKYDAVPWVTYTYPELAHVGMTMQQAQSMSGIQCLEWSFNESDRARTEDETIGKIIVMTDKKGWIKGVTIVGLHAGELILPWVIAMKEHKTLRTFTDAIIPYPTLSEISKFVAGSFYKPKLFSKTTKRIVSWLKQI